MDRNGGQRRSGAAVGPRRTEKLSEVLAREIVRDLRNLSPSTMLPPEASMLEKYGVGRASLREALRLLEVQGLIVIRPGPGGGPMVAQVDSIHYGRISSLYYHMQGATYRDITETRSLLEPVIARVVAERADPEHLQELEGFLERYAASSGRTGLDDDYERYFEESAGFHTMLIEMSGNPVLSLTAHSLHDVLLERMHGLFPPEMRKRVEQEHAAIARAIIKRDASAAERLMRKHMLEYVQYAEERFPSVVEETVDWH